MKTSINGLISSTLSLKKTKQSPVLPTTKAYLTGNVPIDKNKIEDLKTFMEYSTDYSKLLQYHFELADIS